MTMENRRHVRSSIRGTIAALMFLICGLGWVPEQGLFADSAALPGQDGPPFSLREDIAAEERHQAPSPHLRKNEIVILACLSGTMVLMPFLAFYGFRRRRVEGAYAYSGFCLCVTVYAAAYAFQLMSSSLESALMLSKFE